MRTPNRYQNKLIDQSARGPLPDQSALFGVLAKIRDLNLTLVSVQRVIE